MDDTSVPLDGVLSALIEFRGGQITDVERKAATDTWAIVTEWTTPVLPSPELGSNVAVVSAYVSEDKANEIMDSVVSAVFPMISGTSRGKYMKGFLSNISRYLAYVCLQDEAQLPPNMSFWHFVLKHDADVVKTGGKGFPEQIKILSDWNEKYVKLGYDFAECIGNNANSKLAEIHNKWKTKMQKIQFVGFQDYCADGMFVSYAKALDDAKFVY